MLDEKQWIDDGTKEIEKSKDYYEIEPDYLKNHGASCGENSDCKGGLCITPDLHPYFVDGYCSAFCNPSQSDPCGDDAYCVSVDVFPPLCFKACKNDKDCRTPKYTCVGSCIPQSFVKKYVPPNKISGKEKEIQDIVSMISIENLLEHVRVLSGDKVWVSGAGGQIIKSRSVYHPDHDIARKYITTKILEMGLDQKTFVLIQSDKPLMENIKTSILGMNPSKPPVILIAHYDSIADQTYGWNPKTDPAPGASDNGSGVAILLEILRILSSKDFPKPTRTLEVWFSDGEEIGLIGSKNIVKLYSPPYPYCLINVDMLGSYHPAVDKRFWIQVNEGFTDVAFLTFEAISKFVISAKPVLTTYIEKWGTDAVPFRNQGICAISVVSWPRLDNNHTIQDTVSKVEPEFYESAAKSVGAMIGALLYIE